MSSDYTSSKISKLTEENKGRKKKRKKPQIVAIALSMARDRGAPKEKS